MIDTIVYNGFTFTKNNANIQEFVGNGLPDIRSSEELKSQEDGGIPTGYRYSSRTFGWSGDVANTSLATYMATRNSLFAALNLQNQPIEGLTMTFNLSTGDIWTLREVRIVDANFDLREGEVSRTWNSYQVTFRATMPFYEGDETTGTQQVTDIDRGTVVPSPVPSPLTGTAVVTSGTDPLLLTNAGTANAYPVFTITGPGTTFTILNSTTGKSITISETLIAGESIVIDMWEKTIMKGTQSLIGLMSDYFFPLIPGTNQLSFSVASGNTTDTQLQTVFKDTYIGL